MNLARPANENAPAGQSRGVPTLSPPPRRDLAGDLPPERHRDEDCNTPRRQDPGPRHPVAAVADRLRRRDPRPEGRRPDRGSPGASAVTPDSPRRSGAAPLAATLVSAVVFFFSVLASTAFKWHPVITGPLAVACAVALLVSVIWLN